MYRILIADDEPIMLESLCQMIQRNIPEIEIIATAKNGRDTIEKSHHYRPDILMTDIKMPGINGLDAIKDLKLHLPDLYCIILSAYDYFDYATEAVDLGVNAYLLKPVSEAKLVETLQCAIQKVELNKKRFSQELAFREKVELIRPTLESSLMVALKTPETSGDEMLNYSQLLGYEGWGVIALAMRCNNSAHYQTYLDLLKNQQHHLIGNVRTAHLALLLFLPPQLSEQEVTDTVNQLYQHIYQKMIPGTSPVQFGIGTYKLSASEAVLSYSEACKALEHTTDSHVCHYNDVSHLCQENVGERSSHAIIQKADSYLKSHFQDDVTLEDIARAVNLSPFYFSRFYKDETGVNFIQKLIEIRIDEAKRLLIENDLSLKEVSQRVGYPDPNYLSKLFKKMTGYTATEYKEHFRK